MWLYACSTLEFGEYRTPVQDRALVPCTDSPRLQLGSGRAALASAAHVHRSTCLGLQRRTATCMRNGTGLIPDQRSHPIEGSATRSRGRTKLIPGSGHCRQKNTAGKSLANSASCTTHLQLGRLMLLRRHSPLTEGAANSIAKFPCATTNLKASPSSSPAAKDFYVNSTRHRSEVSWGHRIEID